ncbi:hypothetical protein LP316_11765 [Thalassotalea sp. LPB0316]|uniref:hypothetical protein n=1 Tax=Thalassotalea sp. LPB0316 TaxID=2769490 RepID=UPI001867B1C9|nr:hypothetical protein [Thalassotalea sp. LPB0316]QOL24979.1 hypothetical protein LP316_11765 [Thalassotalea sp. LPB0316]
MNPPWNGEKVNLFIRLLAITFIVCALFAFNALIEKGNLTTVGGDWRDYIAIAFTPYCFILFLKVAITGHAPKTWLPWK